MYGEKAPHYLGEFELSEKAVISDPCYDRPESINRSNAIVDVVPGVWHAEIILSNEGQWGHRVAELYVWNDEWGQHRPKEFLTSCGVDSGQLGVFDYAKYPIGVNGYTAEYGEADNWYTKACNETYDEKDRSKTAGIVDGMGANSSSGFGDGEYEIFVARNGEDKVVSLKAVFIPEDKDND